MRRGWAVTALGVPVAALLLTVAARAEFVVAPDVVVYCEPTLRPVLAEVAAAWRRESGVPVHLFASPTAAVLQQIGHRARADLVVGEGEAAAAEAARRQVIKPETRVTLWRNRLVVVALAAAAPSPAGDPAARIEAGPIAIVDPPVGSAGASSRQALAALGLWPAVESRAVGVVSTADASFLLASGQVRLAILYASDVAANPGFAIAAPLPDAAYPPVVYWLAETQNQLSPKAADFAAWLRQKPAGERARDAGLEVLP
ncbi:MAG: molybdate ABC transporter substrate-binding protein [Stellaceae bacterium]